MANIFEKMGLIQRDEPVTPVQVTTVPEVDETIPDVDVGEIDHLNLINSIYERAGVSEDNSIFKIKSYIDVLPAEMTTVKKQASIAGILALNNMNVADIISDALQRVKILETAEMNIRDANEATICEAESDIEKLKSLIEAAEAKIAEAKNNTANSSAAINAELDQIKSLQEFAEGILNNKEG